MKEVTGKYINKLEEEDREIKLNEQRTEEEGKERMENKPTEAETAEEEVIEEGERPNKTCWNMLGLCIMNSNLSNLHMSRLSC